MWLTFSFCLFCFLFSFLFSFLFLFWFVFLFSCYVLCVFFFFFFVKMRQWFCWDSRSMAMTSNREESFLCKWRLVRKKLSCPCFGSSVLASCIDLYAQVKTGSPKAVRFLIIMNLFLNRQYKLNVLRDIVMSILFLFVFSCWWKKQFIICELFSSFQKIKVLSWTFS